MMLGDVRVVELLFDGGARPMEPLGCMSGIVMLAFSRTASRSRCLASTNCLCVSSGRPDMMILNYSNVFLSLVEGL